MCQQCPKICRFGWELWITCYHCAPPETTGPPTSTCFSTNFSAVRICWLSARRWGLTGRPAWSVATWRLSRMLSRSTSSAGTDSAESRNARRPGGWRRQGGWGQRSGQVRNVSKPSGWRRQGGWGSLVVAGCGREGGDTPPFPSRMCDSTDLNGARVNSRTADFGHDHKFISS